jgi:hypothetical protein
MQWGSMVALVRPHHHPPVQDAFECGPVHHIICTQHEHLQQQQQQQQQVSQQQQQQQQQQQCSHNWSFTVCL